MFEGVRERRRAVRQPIPPPSTSPGERDAAALAQGRSRPAWAEIDLAAITHNAGVLARLVHLPELVEKARAHLQVSHLRGAAQCWHFQRRNGAIADNLIAVADELRRQHGPDAAVVLIVGRSEHGYHHVLGSVPSALERHVHYPVIVIP